MKFTKEEIAKARDYIETYAATDYTKVLVKEALDHIEHLQKRVQELEAKVESAGDLLESISVWFWKTQGLQPDPMWVDQFKSVCNLFEPIRKDNDETSCL